MAGTSIISMHPQLCNMQFWSFACSSFSPRKSSLINMSSSKPLLHSRFLQKMTTLKRSVEKSQGFSNSSPEDLDSEERDPLKKHDCLSSFYTTEVPRQMEQMTKVGQIEDPKHVQRRELVLNTAVAFGLGFACQCCQEAIAEEWSYGGPSGPTEWAGMCATGIQQSPVDIAVNKVRGGEALGEIIFKYKSSSPTFQNTGHGTMQVNFSKGENRLYINRRELELVQFHFHTPSEHAFDGLRYPMEAHLVHYDLSSRSLAIVGIMLLDTCDAFPNKALAAALRYSPLEHGKVLTVPNVQLSAAFLLPPRRKSDGRRGYMHYRGSLTTPPCSEIVDWFLLEKPLRVPTSQIMEFMKYVGDEHTLAFNSRPLQPLGGRDIFRGP
ncbi:unnamed protein product [Sphagnum troendelagicum]|uniref:carbonic anhydrase n=1 Tax=Sphagnum troendelagicum TaxID=128251 RepID=A0ABP0V1S8_9BRYO